jgi:hypothetical protein
MTGARMTGGALPKVRAMWHNDCSMSPCTLVLRTDILVVT